MLADKNAILQVFGCLMKDSKLLNNSEDYNLLQSDFITPLEKYIFTAIYNLHQDGAEKVSIVDIDNYLSNHAAAYQIFEKENGTEYLQDAEELSQVENFKYYYNRIKKFSCLRDLKAMGYNISKFYCEDDFNTSCFEINERFDLLTTNDIIKSIQKTFSDIESNYTNNGVETKKVSSGIDNLISNLASSPEVGANFQGKIYNTITRGARKGKYYINSAASGTGKTRTLIGDACHIAYPVRYDIYSGKWIQDGDSEKVLFIATEQDIGEVQTMILAYLTNINEEKILLSNFSDTERELIDKAILIIKQYEDNFLIVQMPDPTSSGLKAIVRQNYLNNNIQNLFYDYIFSGPALLTEFRDIKIREDVALRILSTTLKELAVELQIFIASATQITEPQDSGRKGGIKNQQYIRGSKSIIDKADIGSITSSINDEELEMLDGLIQYYGKVPNQVIDVYKVRRGRYSNVKIWSYMDLGTCRKEDLFVTDGNFNEVKEFNVVNFVYHNNYEDIINLLNNGEVTDKTEKLVTSKQDYISTDWSMLI